MPVVPDLQHVFMLPTGPVRVRVTCADTEPTSPVVSVTPESNDWITLLVACGLQQISPSTRDPVDNTVKKIVETALQYFPRQPSPIQVDKFSDALSAWVSEHRRAAAERVHKD